MTDRAEKLKQAGILKHGSELAWRTALAEQGRKGGKTTGESKRRGDTSYYARVGKLGGLSRGKRTQV